MAVDPTFKSDFHHAIAAAGLEFTPPVAWTAHVADTESTHSLAIHEASLAAHCFCSMTVDVQGIECNLTILLSMAYLTLDDCSRPHAAALPESARRKVFLECF